MVISPFEGRSPAAFWVNSPALGEVSSVFLDVLMVVGFFGREEEVGDIDEDVLVEVLLEVRLDVLVEGVEEAISTNVSRKRSHCVIACVVAFEVFGTFGAFVVLAVGLMLLPVCGRKHFNFCIEKKGICV